MADSNPVQELVDQFKIGYKTTEFWGAKVALLIPIIAWGAALFGYDVDVQQLTASFLALLPELAYIFNRTWVKKQRLQTYAAVAVPDARATAITDVLTSTSTTIPSAGDDDLASDDDDLVDGAIDEIPEDDFSDEVNNIGPDGEPLITDGENTTPEEK